MIFKTGRYSGFLRPISYIIDLCIIHVWAYYYFKDTIPFDWSAYPNLNAYYDRMRADVDWAATAPESVEAMGRKPAVA